MSPQAYRAESDLTVVDFPGTNSLAAELRDATKRWAWLPSLFIVVLRFDGAPNSAHVEAMNAIAGRAASADVLICVNQVSRMGDQLAEFDFEVLRTHFASVLNVTRAAVLFTEMLNHTPALRAAGVDSVERVRSWLAANR